MEQIYDLIIIGSGPAGISAAMGAHDAGLNFLIIDGSHLIGGKMNIIPEVDGFPSLFGASGMELAATLYNQAAGLGIEFSHEAVEFLELSDSIKSVITDENEYAARAVILALGTSPKELERYNDFPLPDTGVSFSAMIHSEYFSDKTVAVIGSGREAVQSALFLSDISSRIYLISDKNELSASRRLIDRLYDTPNISFLHGYRLNEIVGDEQVEAAWIENIVTKDKKTVPVDGIVLTESMTPNTAIVGDLLTLNYEGYIFAKEDCRTSIDLVYAAGDVRIKPERNILSAINDGQMAINSLLKDLDK